MDMNRESKMDMNKMFLYTAAKNDVPFYTPVPYKWTRANYQEPQSRLVI